MTKGRIFKIIFLVIVTLLCATNSTISNLFLELPEWALYPGIVILFTAYFFFSYNHPANQTQKKQAVDFSEYVFMLAIAAAVFFLTSVLGAGLIISICFAISAFLITMGVLEKDPQENSNVGTKIGKIIGAVNATLINGFLVVGSLSVSTNAFFSRTINAENILQASANDLNWQSIILLLAFLVGTYASYTVTRKNIIQLFERIYNKITDNSDNKSGLEKIKDFFFKDKKALFFGIIGLAAGIGIGYRMSGFLSETLTNWGWSSEVVTIFSISAFIITIIAGGALVGNGSYEAWKQFEISGSKKSDAKKSNTLITIKALIILFSFTASSMISLAIIGSITKLKQLPEGFGNCFFVYVIAPSLFIAFGLLFNSSIRSFPAWRTHFAIEKKTNTNSNLGIKKQGLTKLTYNKEKVEKIIQNHKKEIIQNHKNVKAEDVENIKTGHIDVDQEQEQAQAQAQEEIIKTIFLLMKSNNENKFNPSLKEALMILDLNDTNTSKIALMVLKKAYASVIAPLTYENSDSEKSLTDQFNQLKTEQKNTTKRKQNLK